MVRNVTGPFAPTGGLRLLQGNLGRAIVKASAVPEDAWIIRAPAKESSIRKTRWVKTYKASQLNPRFCGGRDFQGPQAEWYAELAFTPVLGSLMSAGHKVAFGDRWSYVWRLWQSACGLACQP